MTVSQKPATRQPSPHREPAFETPEIRAAVARHEIDVWDMGYRAPEPKRPDQYVQVNERGFKTIVPVYAPGVGI